MALRPDVLRYKRDFDRLYKKGRSVGDKYVVLFQRNNGLPYSRKAFLASKKVGGAVARNRARRLMKESFRNLEKRGGVAAGNDILLIARQTIGDAKCSEVEASVARVLKKSGLLI